MYICIEKDLGDFFNLISTGTCIFCFVFVVLCNKKKIKKLKFEGKSSLGSKVYVNYSP